MADLRGGVFAAFQRSVSLGKARHLDRLRGRQGKACNLRLVHLSRKIRGTETHLLRQVFGNHIDHKLTRAANIAGRILGNEFLIGAIGHAQGHDRRVGTKIVISAEGSRIEPPLFVYAGDQRNRPRRDQSGQQLVGYVLAGILQIEIHSRSPCFRENKLWLTTCS